MTSRRPTTPRAATATTSVAVLLAAALLAAAGVVTGPHGPTAAAVVPSRVLPDAGDGEDVTLSPVAVRAPDGRAELELGLGADAPGDVVVRWSLTRAAVDDTGAVTAGDPGGLTGTVSAGARVRPGERLRATVDVAADGPPVLVVATVRGAVEVGASPPGRPQRLEALVLVGPTGPAPSVELVREGDQLVGTVDTEEPLLVSVRLTGRSARSLPDRLLLPDRPLHLQGTPARWPNPSVLVVTDEQGRTVTVDTGRGPVLVIAALLVTGSLAALVLLLGHRRRRATPDS